MLTSILIVEDDPLVAIMVEGYLDALGYEIAASCETVAAALAHIDPEKIDAAIVDVHLADGELAGPVVEALRTAGIPFLVTTGGHNVVSDPRFDGAAMLTKPFSLANLEAGLAGLASAAAD